MNLKGGRRCQGQAFPQSFRTDPTADRARDATDKQYKSLGEKEIDGKTAIGFIYDSPTATVTLWGDPKTHVPVRIESVWSGIPRSEVVMTRFEINVDLKESLFDLTPPAGFKVNSIDVDTAQPGQQDLVTAFKACSDIGNGDFPETLDMPASPS